MRGILCFVSQRALFCEKRTIEYDGAFGMENRQADVFGQLARSRRDSWHAAAVTTDTQPP